MGCSCSIFSLLNFTFSVSTSSINIQIAQKKMGVDTLYKKRRSLCYFSSSACGSFIDFSCLSDVVNVHMLSISYPLNEWRNLSPYLICTNSKIEYMFECFIRESKSIFDICTNSKIEYMFECFISNPPSLSKLNLRYQKSSLRYQKSEI